MPASRATAIAIGRLPVLSAATMPKNAPMIMHPSSAMFVPPERPVTTPPRAANAMGVASLSVVARTPAPMRTSRLTAAPRRSSEGLGRRAAAVRDGAHDRLRGDDEEDDRLDDLDQMR